MKDTKRELNPWHIETESYADRPQDIRLRIINGTTGEIKAIVLTVDDIDRIIREDWKRNDKK